MLNVPVQKRTAPTQLLQLAKSEAQKILMNTRGVDFVMICSSDGFELATVSHKNYPNTTKFRKGKNLQICVNNVAIVLTVQ